MGERTNRRRNECAHARTDRWMNEWVSETHRQGIRKKRRERKKEKKGRWTKQLRNERTYARADGRTDGWMNEWVSEWVSEWMKEWLNEWKKRKKIKKNRPTDHRDRLFADVLRAWRSSLERLRWRLISISNHRELLNSWSRRTFRGVVMSRTTCDLIHLHNVTPALTLIHTSDREKALKKRVCIVWSQMSM